MGLAPVADLRARRDRLGDRLPADPHRPPAAARARGTSCRLKREGCVSRHRGSPLLLERGLWPARQPYSYPRYAVPCRCLFLVIVRVVPCAAGVGADRGAAGRGGRGGRDALDDARVRRGRLASPVVWYSGAPPSAGFGGVLPGVMRAARRRLFRGAAAPTLLIGAPRSLAGPAGGAR